mmetsp:Transcript_31457/g.51903  ORF Transcript_31457/g.51903 Transcript_31457/m.51903 type:complete len:126 (+) Transcript_31457:75-452(+)
MGFITGLGNALYNTGEKFGLGQLPKEYNPKVHGPYDPAIYYGPRDTPLSQVKVGELPAWLARRSKNPIDWTRAGSRAYWRWAHKYAMPKYCGMVPFFQVFAFSMTFFYIMNSPNISHHKNHKYHW